MSHDPRVDAYLASRPAFAQPILTHLRELVHRSCPELDETIKWSMPFFVLGDRPIANMAGFKAHVAFGFWRRGAAPDERNGAAMGQFGRLTSIADLPSDERLAAMLRDAIAQAGEGGHARSRADLRPVLAIPADLVEALAAVPAAQAGFDALPPGSRREYVEWIEQAKRPETRAGRIARTVAQSAEGRKLNWKYEAGCK